MIAGISQSQSVDACTAYAANAPPGGGHERGRPARARPDEGQRQEEADERDAADPQLGEGLGHDAVRIEHREVRRASLEPHLRIRAGAGAEERPLTELLDRDAPVERAIAGQAREARGAEPDHRCERDDRDHRREPSGINASALRNCSRREERQRHGERGEGSDHHEEAIAEVVAGSSDDSRVRGLERRHGKQWPAGGGRGSIATT